MSHSYIERLRKVLLLIFMLSGPLLNANAQSSEKELAATYFMVAEAMDQKRFDDAASKGAEWLKSIPEKNTLPAMRLADLAELVGIAYYRAGKLEHSVDPLRRGLSIAIRELGPDALQIGQRLTMLGNIYNLLGRHQLALPLLVDADRIFGAQKGLASKEKAQSLKNLAQSYDALGDFKSALPLMEQALSIQEKVSGAKLEDTATILTNLAFMYSDAGLYQQAVPVSQRALNLQGEIFGSQHPNYVTALGDLASLYVALAQYEKAKPLLERALNIDEATQGSNHPNTAWSLDNLAEFYRTLALYSKALPLQERALRLRESTLGPMHSDTAISLNNLALIYTALGRNTEALNLQKRELQITQEKSRTAGQKYIIKSRINLASTLSALGEYKEALDFRRETLKMSEMSYGVNHSLTAICAKDFASSLMDLAMYDEALPLLERALSIQKEKLGFNHPDTASSISDLAQLYRDIGNYKKALSLDQEALKIREEALGSDHPLTGRSLNNLALDFEIQAQYQLALPLRERSLKISKGTFGTEHVDYAIDLINLASTYDQLAFHDRALPMIQEACRVLELAAGPVHETTASCLSNLALSHKIDGAYVKVIALQEQALNISERLLGPVHPMTASRLANLAASFSDKGNFEQAIPLNVRALKIRERTYGTKHPDTAASINNLAEDYRNLGDYEKAISLQKQALRIQEEVLGPNHPTTATSLNNMSVSLSRVGRYDQSISILQRALEINMSVFGETHPSIALILGNLASTYYSLNQYSQALSTQEKALKALEEIYGKDHAQTATALMNLAVYCGSNHQFDRSMGLSWRAWKIMVATLGEAHPDVAQLLSNISFTYADLGEIELAIAISKKSVNIYQSTRQRISTIGTSELQSYTKSVGASYRSLADFLVAQGRLSEAQLVLDMLKEDEQFDFVRRSEKIDSRKTHINFTSTELKWMDRYQDIEKNLAALGAEATALKMAANFGLTPEQKARQKKLSSDLEVAQMAFESFLGEMRAGFAAKGITRVVDAIEISDQAMHESQALLKGLGNNSVLLRYYITDEKVGMLLTTPGVQLARSSSVKATELNRQIAQYRRLLRDPKSDPQPAAKALYELLVAPVAKDLDDAGAKTVMLSLDGTLRYLPFGALHDGKQYLAQRWNLPIYTSVAKAKLRDTVTPQWQAAGLGVTRALGDFAALPAVKGEMVSIVRAGKTGVLPGEVYLDEAFDAVRLKEVVQRKFQLLHVASHFRFSPGTEVNSFLLLGDGQHLTLGDIRTQDYRFDNVDLLTLSACDTGLGGGRDEKGREIEGFGVIAQQQGAKAVLATLWPVADQSTAELMGNLYRSRQERGLTKIEALRQAQLSLLSQPKYSHPFYWAPFILMGNWK